MKKLIMLLIMCVCLVACNTNDNIKVNEALKQLDISTHKVSYSNESEIDTVETFCLDGYKFVYVDGVRAGGLVQFRVNDNGTERLAKCD